MVGASCLFLFFSLSQYLAPAPPGLLLASSGKCLFNMSLQCAKTDPHTQRVRTLLCTFIKRHPFFSCPKRKASFPCYFPTAFTFMYDEGPFRKRGRGANVEKPITSTSQAALGSHISRRRLEPCKNFFVTAVYWCRFRKWSSRP